MNVYKWCSLLNACIFITFVSAVTIAAIHFNTTSLLWWYVLLPLILFHTDTRDDFDKRANGSWKRVSYNSYTCHHICSSCNHASSEAYNYCPNCGARMKGANE